MSAKSGLMGAPGSGMRHPFSNPYAWPGYTTSPVVVFTGAYARLTDSTCFAVRQSGPSPLLHCNTNGSNVHFSGFETIPSFTPSEASHAFNTAFASSATLAGGT